MKYKEYTCKRCQGAGSYIIYYYHMRKGETNVRFCTCDPHRTHNAKSLCWQCEGKGVFDWVDEIKGKNLDQYEYIRGISEIQNIMITRIEPCFKDDDVLTEYEVPL